MIKLVARKALLLAAGWFFASILIFWLLRLLPGDASTVLGGTTATAAEVQATRAELGLDAPPLVQYFTWIFKLFTLDFGVSPLTQTPVFDQLVLKTQVSLPLICGAIFLTAIFAAVPGVLLAFFHHKKAARFSATALNAIAAIPPVFIALCVITFFATRLQLFPSQGFPDTGWNDFFAALNALILPALTIAIIEASVLFRFIYSQTLTALSADRVRTGMSVGYTRFAALIRYGLPEVSLSIMGTLWVQLTALFAGTVVIEQVFSLPGVGSMLVRDIANRDLPQAASTLMVLTTVILVLGFILDILQILVDPRLKNPALAKDTP